MTYIVTMAPRSSWEYEEGMEGDHEAIEIRVTDPASGADLEIDGCAGVSLEKGQRQLTEASEKRLTASAEEPITARTVKDSLTVRIGDAVDNRREQ